MRVQVRVGGDELESELRGLYGWLAQQPPVRNAAAVSLMKRTGRPGEMGGWLDTPGFGVVG